jgi:hypothetical protein
LRYSCGVQGSLLAGFTGSTRCEMEITPFVPDRLLYSTRLSGHDDGGESSPPDKNPCVAEGSRSMFGYSFLSTPSIPLFMSGGEFNAGYVYLPSQTPDLRGKGERGKGRWLYASMIDRDQLKQSSKRDMLDDVRPTPTFIDRKPMMKSVSLQAAGIDRDSIPVPYMLYNDAKAIIKHKK